MEPARAGTIAHGEIAASFSGTPAYGHRTSHGGSTGPGGAELRLTATNDAAFRVDLFVVQNHTLFIGEVKPDGPQGQAQATGDLVFYLGEITAALRDGNLGTAARAAVRSRRFIDFLNPLSGHLDDVWDVRLMDSGHWTPTVPVGLHLNPAKPPLCAQMLFVRFAGSGVYLYSCQPHKAVVEARPDCGCALPVSPPIPVVRDVRETNEQEARQRRAERQRQVDVIGGVAAATAVTAIAARFGPAILRAFPGIAARLGLRMIPVVGWLMIIVSTAEAADKLAHGARLGVPGGPEGTEGAQGASATGDASATGGLRPPEDIDLSQLPTSSISPELVQLIADDPALQNFMWEVARQKVQNNGTPPNAEQLRQLASALRNVDPARVRQLVPLMRAGNNSNLNAMADAIQSSVPGAGGRGSSGTPPPPPPGGQPTRTSQQAGQGAARQAGSQTDPQPPAGQPSSTQPPDPNAPAPGPGDVTTSQMAATLRDHPNLAAFINEFLAPSTTSGTPISREFLQYLIDHVEVLDDPQLIAALRASSRSGPPDLDRLRAAIEARGRARGERRAEGQEGAASSSGGGRPAARGSEQGEGGSPAGHGRTSGAGTGGEAGRSGGDRMRDRSSGEQGGAARGQGGGGRGRGRGAGTGGGGRGGGATVIQPRAAGAGERMEGDQAVQITLTYESGIPRDLPNGATRSVRVSFETGDGQRYHSVIPYVVKSRDETDGVVLHLESANPEPLLLRIPNSERVGVVNPGATMTVTFQPRAH